MAKIPANRPKYWEEVRRTLYSRIARVNVNLRAKIAIGIILPMVLVLTIFSIYEYYRDRSKMLGDLSIVASETGDIIETTLRHEMLESDFEGIQRIMDAYYSRGSFERLLILNTSAEIIFSPNQEGVGTQLDNREPECQPCHKLPVDQRPNSVVIESANGEFIFRSMKPIYNEPECTECHPESERIRGLLLNDISIKPYTDVLNTDFREQMLKGTSIIVLSVVIVYISIDRFVLQGIDDLSSDMSEFAKGRKPSARRKSRGDEIGRLAHAFEDMANEVETRYTENQELNEKLNHQSALRGQLLKRLITSQEDERNRLARDLHDEFGQTLGGLALKTESIAKLLDSNPSLASQELGKMGKLIHLSTDKMYELIKKLRPSLLDDLGLIPALRDLAKRVLDNTGIEFTLHHDEPIQRLPGEIEVTIYRMFQEALHNIIKHSEATQINARLMRRDGVFICEIADNGGGFDESILSSAHDNRQSFGLLGMQERIALCGGTLEISSSIGNGTTLVAKIPIAEKTDGE